MVKRRMKALLTRDDATFAMKLNAQGEAAYERPTMHTAKLRSNELVVKHWAPNSPPDGASKIPEGLSPKTESEAGVKLASSDRH